MLSFFNRVRFLGALCLAVVAAILFQPCPAHAAECSRCGSSDCAYEVGINLAGAEFAGGTLPGVEGTNFRWPSEGALDDWLERGVRLVRLPFKWERLQPALMGDFDPAYQEGLLRSIRWMGERGMLAIPDMHNYAKYRGNNIGSADVPDAAFADAWRRLAELLRDEPAVWGYGLMNEPTGGVDWPHLAQVAIDAIRAVDAQTMILVANDYAAWAATYQTGDLADWAEASLKIGHPSMLHDPSDNLRYELHIYFDHDNSGLYNHSYAFEINRGSRVSPMVGVARIRPFVEWLQRHHVRGFVGEYGCPANPANDPRWLDTLDNTLAYMREHCLPSTIWAAGEMWTPGLRYVVERRGWSRDLSDELRLRDRPQTLLLRRYMDPSPMTTREEAQLALYLAGDFLSEPSVPIPVILDADMDSDVDDVGTLAMLHALADLGEVDILGVMICSKNPSSTLCADRINTYFGRADLPLGNLKGAGVQLPSPYAATVAAEFPGTLSSAGEAPDAVGLYRQLLAAQPDHSVVIVSVGYLTILRDVLSSGPDAHSSLNGRDLVERKVQRWVCMGGKFPSGEESNIRYDRTASAEVVPDWPTEIVFSGWEIGNAIDTGGSILSLPSDNPVRRAYQLFNRIPHKSWDQAALLYAVRGMGKDADGGYWDLSPPGRMIINPSTGHNSWESDPNGTQRHKLPHDPALSAKFASEINALMMHVPGDLDPPPDDPPPEDPLPEDPLPPMAGLLFRDDFGGTEVDTETWERLRSDNSGVYSVDDGHLRLAIRGASHRSRVVTWRDDFNFFAQPLRIDWRIDSDRTLVLPVGYYKSYMPMANHQIRITEGSDTTSGAGSAVSLSLTAAYSISGGTVREFHRLGRDEIDGVPTRILWTLDGQAWTVTIEGAVFLAGHPSERAGTYAVQASDFAGFRLMLATMGAENYTASAYVDSLAVYGPDQCAGTLLVVL